MQASPDIVLYRNAVQYLSVLVGVAACLVLAIVFALIESAYTLMALVFLALSLPVAAYALKRLLRSDPVFVVDRTGIVDETTAVSVGRVNWRDIERIEWRSLPFNQRVISIVVRDPGALLRRQGALKRTALSLNRLLRLPPVNIGQASVTMDFEELLLELQRRLETSQERGIAGE